MKKMTRALSISQKIAFLILLVYIMFLTYVMLFGFGRFPNSAYMYNLVPFTTIKHFLDIEQFNTSTWVINLIGNIGVFVPFGILLPLIGVKNAIKAYGFFLVLIILLELTQLLSRRGSLDIDDVLLNSIGYWIGYGFYFIYRRVRRNV